MISIRISSPGGNRRPTSAAVIGGEVLTQLARIKKVIRPAQQKISRNVIFKVEGIKQSLLITALFAHHVDAPPWPPS
jgi:hypothetical protein